VINGSDPPRRTLYLHQGKHRPVRLLIEQTSPSPKLRLGEGARRADEGCLAKQGGLASGTTALLRSAALIRRFAPPSPIRFANRKTMSMF
jgi:hypothetical protein